MAGTRKTKKGSSPTLVVRITPDQWETAKRSQSGACLIADAIQRDYPHLSKVSVDMATIRASDRAKGVRYIYLAPPAAQHVLLAFDQGWPNPADELTVRRAVQVVPIIRQKTGKFSPAAVAERQAERKQELEAKVAAGETLTRAERGALTKLQREYDPLPRPSSAGAPEVVGAERGQPVVVGGKPPRQGPAHPNLLRGRNRHFGAKLADPGLVFKEALEEAVAQKLAELSG